MIKVRIEHWEPEMGRYITRYASTYAAAINPMRPRDLTVQAARYVSLDPRQAPPPKFFSHDHQRLTDVGDGLIYDDGTYYVRRAN